MVKEEKKNIVEKVAEKIKSAKTVAVIDLFNLPAKQLHGVRKLIRGSADIIIEKATLLQRAVKASGKEKLLGFLGGQKAIVTASMDPFQLYKTMTANPLKVYAKPGQVAPSDIIVPAGETTLPPGPVLSELKQAKIDARIQAGKIFIGKDSVVAKEGEKITSSIAGVLQKLDIRPFELKINIPVILEGDLIYRKEVLDINEEEFIGKVKQLAANAFNLTTNIVYPTADNIKLFLQKAYREARGIGIEFGIAVPELMEEIVKKASREAAVLGEKVGPMEEKKEEKPAEEKKEEEKPTEEKKEEKVEEKKEGEEKKEESSS